MAIYHCKNCGAELDTTARFCRQCGVPSDPGEATTRTLDQPPMYEAPTSHINPSYTTPTYMVAGSPLEPVPPTNELAPPAGQKKTIIFLASVVVILLIALIGMGIFMAARGTGGPVEDPPMVSAPPPPGMPAGHPPPEPPVPPVPPVEGIGEGVSSDLKYPGSETVMDVTSGDGESVLQLQTSDRIEKVVQWYVARLKPTKRVNLPGGTAVLKGSGMTAVITGGNGEVTIILKQGEED